jgi:hypothetical protein
MCGLNFNFQKFQYGITQLSNYFLKQNKFPPTPALVKIQNINEGRRARFEVLTAEIIKIPYYRVHIRDLYRGIIDFRKG